MINQIEIVEKILQTLLPIITIVLVGFLYAKKYQPDMKVANAMNIDIFCPALIFSVVAAKSFDISMYLPYIFAGIVIVLGSGLLLWSLCRLMNLSAKTLVLPAMFSNTGNLGLPLLVLAFGEKALPIAVVLFIVENTLHFTVGIYLLDHRANPLRTLKMPMMLATIIGLLVSVYQINIPQFIGLPIDMLGQISIPLMLFALGTRLTQIHFKDWKIGLGGAILTPLSGFVIFLVLMSLWSVSQETFNYLLLFSLLPPAVLNYLVAEKYNQSPQQVASIVLMGNLFSVLVIPVALYYIYHFAAQ